MYLPFRTIFRHREEFAPHAPKLRVVRSEMLFGRLPDGPAVTVVGVVRNDSPVAWGWVEVQAQLLSERGGLVDVLAPAADSTMATAVLPGEEVAFKAQGVASLALETYASHAVQVRGAWDHARAP
jgi:hypothetical protein